MEEIFKRQSQLIKIIEKICVNFSKDGPSRKTKEYIEKRLSALDSLWSEFDSNNEILTADENRKHEYFTNNIYMRMKEFYDNERKKIANYPVPSTSSANEESDNDDDNFDVPKSNTDSDYRQITDELLTQQRTNFRAFLRIINRINIDNIEERWEIEDQLKELQRRWRVIDEQHLRIDNLLQGQDKQYDAEFLKYEEKYSNIKKQLNRKLNSTTHLQQSTPKVEIPVFTGKYSQWPTFFDLFKETIHNNNSLSKAQKMQHLKGKVKGEAERLIQHLNISSDNYDTAWELLTHRYNNTHALFTHQIEIFLNQPSISKQSSFELKRLYDTTMETIHAIHNLGVDTSTWDPLLVHLIAKKLDASTYTDYKEARLSPRDLPTFEELMNFIESKFVALEPINKKEKDTTEIKSTPAPQSFKGSYYKPHYQVKNRQSYQAVPTYTPKCPMCHAEHDLYKCKRFLNLSADAKMRTLVKQQICQNCLYKHFDKPCISTRRCKYCNNEHNSIIHHDLMQLQSSLQRNSTPMPSSSSATSENIASSVPKPSNKPLNVSHVAAEDEEILLTTLSLKVKSSDNTYVTLRALLDQGSQISLISENAAQVLGLRRQRFNACVSGIGVSSKPSKGMVTLDCESIYGDYNFTTQALVISRVINNLPNATLNRISWPHLNNINLADPEYHISKPIDLLLDASVYSDIIMSGLIKGSLHAPIAQQTKLGWILSGSVKTFNCNVIINQVGDLSKFWEIEDISQPSLTMTEQEQYCEDFYLSTTRRLDCGRYEVALPMKPDFKQNLGASKSKAVMQFKQIEKRMINNPSLSDAYTKFMHEYETLRHMRPADSVASQPTCYLPHHGVLKMDSTTTKLRVVFNASARTSSGYSLNDLMECGPNLQQDLQALILRWRTHKYVVTADIEKMFRQFLVRECDQPLQSIIWREKPQDLLREYLLTTVTYGTKAAPFLAMRTLRQIARDNATKYPLAADAIENCFYTDDLMTGNDTIAQVQQLQTQLIKVLKSAGLNLRKWSSNERELVSDLPSDDANVPYEFKDMESRKTLGLRWNPSSDTFTFQNKLIYQESQGSHTKRQFLSDISKIYDPLGWLSPVTIKAKILFQKTWLSDLQWDDELPSEILTEWQHLRADLKNIENISIPRYLGNKHSYQIHGFCDASEKAYACAVYAVLYENKGECTSRLIAAKTKVAPQSKPLSLPRLELLGALLLSRLMKKVVDSISAENITINAWSDSMVVLGWLHGDISRWKQFVANRVRQITDIIPASHWRYVKSEDNAADCATRGLSSSYLQQKLWWEGPQWLTSFDLRDMNPVKIENTTVEIKKAHVNAALQQDSIIIKLLEKCSSLTRVVRIVGWMSRFVTQLRNRPAASNKITHSASKCILSTVEIQNAQNLIIKSVQALEFQDDIYHIKKNGHVRSNSKISSLNPFLDEHGILRVGGRLHNAKISYSAKHPILLTSHHRLTELIVQFSHISTLHGGPKLTLSHIREKFWIVSGIRTVKKLIRLCVKCRRYSQETKQQIMADLPTPRVTPARPFTNTGVDFTGHVDIKANKGRGIKTVKGYVAVFVCLVTKAVHLELVSDLSTVAFLAAFRRMCARRGTPRHVYSDNGTNFVGASRLLKKEYKAILETMDASFIKDINDMGITWHFNAPAWPSAGGLWEAAVKSMKAHLKRVLGEQKLTYEEFITLLHQIEACMNSRPLCPLNESLEDEILTPGHFLVGDSLLSRPQTEPDNINLPARWHLVQSMNKALWKKWSSEYLQQLQARTKWRTPTKNLEVDDIVIIKEDNLPPGKWAMGRIQELHPGKDGYVRVVSLKTHNNVIKRPINKLIMLPVHDVTRPHVPQADELPNSPTSQHGIARERCRRPRNKRSCVHYVSMALLWFMTLISSTIQQSALPYNTTALNTNQSLYFDKMSELQHIRDEWKLIIYYNMSTYWNGLSNINKYLYHLKEMCQNQRAQYESIILQLEHETHEIEHYNSLLKYHRNERQKRGLVNGIGYLANSLFGVLDERFAEQYRDDIEKITLNESHLQNLIKNQTLVIESEYNILRRNEKIMNTQFTIINQHLRNLTLGVQEVRFEVLNSAYITSSALALNIIISNLRRIQQTLINTLTDVSHGRIDAHLLPPEQLQEQMSIIQGQLHGELILPTEKYNVQQLYKVLKVFARVVKNYLIIEVRIPLVSNELYELDQIFTIPLRHGENNKQYTIPTYPYIAFNLKRDSAILLSQKDVQSCLHMQPGKLICSIDRPIYELKHKQSICDIKLLHTESIAYSPCAVQLAPCAADKWIKLHRQNSWLYSCCKQCNIRIQCAARMKITTLSGNGIISLGQGCTIKGDMYTIFSHQNYLSHLQSNPDEIDVPEISILNTIINTSLPYEELPLQDTRPQTWHDVKAQIEQLKTDSSQQMTSHDVHHYVLQYLLLGGLLALAAVIIFLWRRTRAPPSPSACAASAPPPPPPRAAYCASPRAAASVVAATDTAAPKFEVPTARASED